MQAEKDASPGRLREIEGFLNSDGSSFSKLGD
jgi:hypothetical protein